MLTALTSRFSAVKAPSRSISFESLGKKLDSSTDSFRSTLKKSEKFPIYSLRVQDHIATGDVKLDFAGERKLNELKDNEKVTQQSLNVRKYSFLTMVGSALAFTFTPYHCCGVIASVPFIAVLTGGVSLMGVAIGACAYTDDKDKNKKLYDEICMTYCTVPPKPKVESTVIVVDIQSELAKTLTQTIKDGQKDNKQ